MVQKRYSDILADILQTKHSKCTCPPEYFTSAKSPSPKRPPSAGCCQFGPDCQFAEHCEASDPSPADCQYNKAKCTCYPQCICGPQPQLPVQLLQRPELDKVIDTQMCTCGANCLCEDEDAIIRPTNDCNKARCICKVCFCRPDVSNSRLLPSHFRNAIKKEPPMSVEERIKQDCDEIKQMLKEHEESKKKELEESTNPAIEKDKDKGNKKQVGLPKVSNPEEHTIQPIVQPTPSENKEENIRDSIPGQEVAKSPKLSQSKCPKDPKSKGTKDPKPKVPPQKSPKPKVPQTPTIKNKKEDSRKGKIPKKPRIIQSARVPMKPTTPSQFTQYSCGCRMPKQRPVHMRYYFSGGTENYGVKTGHKQCQPKPALVPRNMGWLWNIEDPSKGIRERKGWPPGFIGKNIKNMIKVLKQASDPAESPKPTSSAPARTRFGFQRRDEGEVAEPQEEPPLLHIHKKGRTYNITFCPKSSDTDIGPIPIPFSITEKKHDSDSSSSDSTLEFEFHSPKPKMPLPPPEPRVEEEKPPEEEAPPTESAPPPSTIKTKKKPNKKRSSKSAEADENKNLWEEQQTQIENIA